MANLTVGTGKQFTRVTDAINASRDGDVIMIDAGTYTNEFATITKKISLVGVGGMAHFTATTAPTNSKGMFITQNDVTFDQIEFSNVRGAPGKNGAGIRYESGNLTVKNSYFHDNEEGILAAPNSSGTVTIDHSEFARNGYGDGQSHGIYINAVKQLTVTNSYFHDQVTGHHIKTRALNSTITNNVLDDGSRDSVYAIDMPNGGNAYVKGNTMVQGVNGNNPIMVAYGAEGNIHASSSFTMEDNVLMNYRSSSIGVRNFTTNITGKLVNNDFYHLDTLTQGPLTQSGTEVLNSAVSYSKDSPWKGTTTTPTPTPTPTPEPTPTPTPGVINGTASNDTLQGTSGADTIDGKAGADKMTGGAGDDTYYVDNAGDVVVEVAGGGQDTVISSVSHTLAQFVNTLKLAGTAAINGTGNVWDETIVGNSANNVLNGMEGTDVLTGGAGNDTFVHANGHGNDTITDFAASAAGGDVMKLNGSTLTTFAQIKAAMTLVGSDTVLKLENGETITFKGVSPDKFTAEDFGMVTAPVVNHTQELFSLPTTGAATRTVTGTSSNNTLNGSTGNDKMDGGAGADVMTGGSGDDTYVVDNVGDKCIEQAGGGIDKVVSSVSYTLENYTNDLELTGTAALNGTGNQWDNRLTGNAAANQLNGGDGNDILIGKGGADVLTGGNGSDIFDYNALSDAGDTIRDFKPGEDMLDLRDLMKAMGVTSDPLASGKLQLVQNGADTLVKVDADGSAGAGQAQTLVTLLGVNAQEMQLQHDLHWQ